MSIEKIIPMILPGAAIFFLFVEVIYLLKERKTTSAHQNAKAGWFIVSEGLDLLHRILRGFVWLFIHVAIVIGIFCIVIGLFFAAFPIIISELLKQLYKELGGKEL